MSALISAMAQPERFRLVSSGSETMASIAAEESVQPERSSVRSVGRRERMLKSIAAPWCRLRERKPEK